MKMSLLNGCRKRMWSNRCVHHVRKLCVSLISYWFWLWWQELMRGFSLKHSQCWGRYHHPLMLLIQTCSRSIRFQIFGTIWPLQTRLNVWLLFSKSLISSSSRHFAWSALWIRWWFASLFRITLTLWVTSWSTRVSRALPMFKVVLLSPLVWTFFFLKDLETWRKGLVADHLQLLQMRIMRFKLQVILVFIKHINS